ncbi:MAG TPA: PilX N-terminal domain-containing pilus assembly protein [Burkholderiaceae bacterium]|nr:PilX N-terminal domain-containing pilus assembly protein [Burkholderiaceae bacterium]
MKHTACSSARQRGFSLVIAIVFLLLFSLFALAGLRSSTTNVLIAGNMQSRQEVVAAAQVLVEQTISSEEFATNPTGVAAVARVDTDFNGDGTTDVVTQMRDANGATTDPYCIRARTIPLNELDINNTNDSPCFSSSSVQNSGIITNSGSSAGSLCADTEWDITVRSADARTGSEVTMHQGVSLRTASIDLATKCK